MPEDPTTEGEWPSSAGGPGQSIRHEPGLVIQEEAVRAQGRPSSAPFINAAHGISTDHHGVHRSLFDATPLNANAMLPAETYNTSIPHIYSS